MARLAASSRMLAMLGLPKPAGTTAQAPSESMHTYWCR
jgi:hypothetical protein